ncbi:MAG: hypothetical protein NTZ13_01015 [Candidatus Parcubacteria bacterium]|nr:hypothetical protein [Candidatus Parcubacteria bacterium]
MQVVAGITLREKFLKKMVEEIKVSIMDSQKVINTAEEEIKLLHQKRCLHLTPQTRDDDTKWCFDCGKDL